MPDPDRRVRRIDVLPARTTRPRGPNLEVARIKTGCLAGQQRLVNAHPCKPALTVTATSSRAPSDQDVRPNLVGDRSRDVALDVELHRARRGRIAMHHDLAQDQPCGRPVAGQSLRQQGDEPTHFLRSSSCGDLNSPRVHFFTVNSGWMLATRSASSASSRLAITGSIGL